MKRVIAAGLGIAILAIWRYAHEIGCIALVFVPVLALPIALSLSETAILRRTVFADAVFVGGTLLHRIWRGRLLAFAFASLTALATSAMLLADLAIGDAWLLYVLALDTVVLVMLMALLDRMLASRLRPVARRIVVKSWASWVNAVLLVATKIAYDFFTLKPPLRQGDAYTTYDGPLTSAQCEILSMLLAVRGRIDGRLRVELETVDHTVIALALWIVFLAVSALGAFGFSRYMVEILDRAR